MNRENTETIISWWNRHRQKDENTDLMTLEKLQEDIRKLEGQEFMMNIPIGGDAHGR